MTSQRFLNDKVNSRDFLRSLKDACLAPIVALIVLSIKYVIPVASFAKELRTNLTYKDLLSKREIISYFGGALEDYGYYYGASIIPIIMIFCGMFMALMLFRFAFKKKSVNVYYSMGITRTRLFLNRILAGAIELLVATVIPLFITFITNVSLFGYNVHQLKLFAYYTFLLFTSGLAGLVIGAFAASISGSIIEMAITSASTSGVVIAAVGIFTFLKGLLLRGYVGTAEDESKIFLLSPWTALLEERDLNRLITGEKVPKDLLITWKADVFPIVLWVIISVAVCALGLLLFKKRKAENSNSFGKFDVSSAINGVMVFFVTVFGFLMIFDDIYGYQIHSVALCILICAVGASVAFFVAELIMRRNIKAVLRMLPVFGGAALFAIISLVVIGTGYFGTFNKLPEAKDIEYVAMSYSDPLGILNYDTYHYYPERYDDEKNTYLCKSSNSEDINLCTEQFNRIKADKKNNNYAIDYVSFVIKTKDGKLISRNFPVYSEDLVHDYNKAVFNSDYFHLILKMKLNDLNSNDADYELTYSEDGGYEYSQIDEDKYSGATTFSYFDGSLLTDNFNYNYHGIDDENVNFYEMTQELKDALYNDLCKMTYDEYYGKGGEPVGAIVWNIETLRYETLKYMAEYDWVDFYGYYYEDSEGAKNTVKTGIASSLILIYPQMTETLEYVKEFEPNPHETAVKAVLYPDKNLSILSAVKNLDEHSVSAGNVHKVFVSAGNSSNDWFYSRKVATLFAEKPQGNYLDFMEIVYNANDSKLTRVDDTEKANKIADASRMVYDTYGDNGRYVYVIYEDDCIVTMYLPEKSLSVLN
ncbi:MAG: hypothetical protein J1F24_05040 [Oscillospiraceae bacterium]|nr:hypothetical protein [Oscillospiraceae bacterium]